MQGRRHCPSRSPAPAGLVPPSPVARREPPAAPPRRPPRTGRPGPRRRPARGGGGPGRRPAAARRSGGPGGDCEEPPRGASRGDESVVHPTRLETRTKESNRGASRRVCKPGGEMKVSRSAAGRSPAGAARPAGGLPTPSPPGGGGGGPGLRRPGLRRLPPEPPRGRGRRGERPRGAGAQAEDLPPSGPGHRRFCRPNPVIHRWQVPGSADVGTRKMVNYAWQGRSQRKLWWRSEAVLTCKSIVGAGYRGERLIEPSSSWFPPKFPSG